MMRPLMTTPDEAEILYSEVQKIDGKEQVRIYIEKWSDRHNAFDSMEMFLPSGKITQQIGFSNGEANYYHRHIMEVKKIIWEIAEEAVDEEEE